LIFFVLIFSDFRVRCCVDESISGWMNSCSIFLWIFKKVLVNISIFSLLASDGWSLQVHVLFSMANLNFVGSVHAFRFRFSINYPSPVIEIDAKNKLSTIAQMHAHTKASLSNPFVG